ncbi:MAG: YcxB family protein [Verrucomicrobiota bacterium]
MRSITARFRWTVEDLIIGSKYDPNSKPSWLLVIGCAALGIFAFAVSGPSPAKQVSHGIHPTAIWVLLIVLGILLVGILVALPLAKKINALVVRRQFAKRPDANMEIEWTFSEVAVKSATTDSKFEVQWSVFHKVISTPKGFLFMSNARVFHFIPHRAFATPADIEDLKTLARQHATRFKEKK